MNLDDVVLLRIFSYLSVNDLIECSKVCKNWYRLVQEEFENNRSRKIETFLFESNKWRHKSSIEIDKSDFIRDWSIEASNIKILPDFSIFTLNLAFLDSHIVEENNTENSEELEEHRRSKRRKHSNTTSSLLLSKFPSILHILRKKASKQVLIFGYGFIGTNINKTRTNEIENDYINPAFSGIMFPKNDSYRFEVRNLSPDYAFKLKSACDLRNLFDLTNQEVESKNLLWLILLTRSNKYLKLFSNAIKDIQKEMNFACSGGLPDLVCEEYSSDKKKQANQVILIGLIGQKSCVNVSQIVIPDEVDFNQVWKEKMDMIKSNQLDGFKSQFAFQISCCGRGKNFHNGIENHESTLLAKSFPKIPIIGVFVNGELGHDYITNLKEDKIEKTFMKELRPLTFSTIFTIIAI